MAETIDELLREYVEKVLFHSNADSSDPKQTKAINKAADRMIEIAELVASKNGTSDFVQLLNHQEKAVRSWAAFHVIERMNPDQETINKALGEIKSIAKSDSMEAFGAELWLKDWNRKNSTNP